ncbi:GNAT family N-acetyltransferase [Litoribrevibacter albus]|uniref:N-acetyltransferase n=1 Tax=Litoribrevibacter albus TaxID=1473156 RepID=A0AA37W7I0_9GAMM|nr:GNAT family N-acetyltransferase [Litoribrevibacter albus]GLQ32635.1 N-acetyltransferase [Litoribrevibacter albus]
MHIENARREDAKALAYLVDLAGEGLPRYLWSEMMTDEASPYDVGAQRASRDEGAFSYKHARVVCRDSRVVGMMLSYQLDDPYVVGDLKSIPKVIQPLIQLESNVPGSWYINAIATDESFRGQGIAKRLMEDAETTAQERGIHLMSLIVASENTAAKHLYQTLGYQCQASLPVILYPGSLHGGDWELMTKQII